MLGDTPLEVGTSATLEVDDGGLNLRSALCGCGSFLVGVDSLLVRKQRACLVVVVVVGIPRRFLTLFGLTLLVEGSDNKDRAKG